MKKLFVFFAVLTAVFTFVACNKKNNESASNNDFMGLEWSNQIGEDMLRKGAENYCKKLKEGGHNDWRLPNIDELRTLIKNHPGTQTGGTCKISKKAGKLSGAEWTTDCNGKDGSNFSKLGNTGIFWSSSVVSNDSTSNWAINFDNGTIYSKDEGIGSAHCVRDVNNQTASQNKRSESVESKKTKCNFSIQLLARQSKNEAIEEAEQYKPMKIRIIEAVVNGTTWYRLRTGCFASREEANEALPEIKDVVKDAMVMPE